MIYVTDMFGVPAESEEEAHRKAEAMLHRLPGVKHENWSESEPETTLDPPEIIEVARMGYDA